MKVRFKGNIIRLMLLAVVWIALPSEVVAQTTATKAEQTTSDKEQKEDKKKKKKKEVVAIADFTQGFEIKSGLRQAIKVRTPEQDSLEVADLSRLIDSLIVAREGLAQEDTTAIATMQGRIDSLTTRRDTLLPKVLATDSLAVGADSLAAVTL